VLRILSDRDDVDLVAINELFDSEQAAYLLRYDTVMGIFEKEVRAERNGLVVGGDKLKMTSHQDPAQIPWRAMKVDYVIESSGAFRDAESLEKHFAAGARKVILTVPPKGDVDAIVVIGVNDDSLRAEHRLVSNASCTTNCLAPIAKILDDAFGIEEGIMTTVHAYTNDQRLADVPHKDPRRSRAAAENIIPTTTGAAKAVGKVLPHLEGRLHGMAIRVPVPDGSIVDLVCRLKATPSRDDINAAVKKAAATARLSRNVQYIEDPVVSSDIIGNPHSSIFDALSTKAPGDGFAEVIAWYDNEWAYANRVVDLIDRMAALEK
jgi:glyceraldehyde 3-phosphate dehydrogenase